MHYRAAMADSRRRPPHPTAAVGTAAMLLSLLILRGQMAKIFRNFVNSAIIAHYRFADRRLQPQFAYQVSSTYDEQRQSY
jgi:hypothetical protein